MRNEVALDLAGFSSGGSRTLQGSRTVARSRVVQNNRTVARSRVVQNNGTAARSVAVQNSRTMPVRNRSMQDSRAVTRSRNMQDNRTAQSRREAAAARERRLMQQKLREQKRRKKFVRQCITMAALCGVICISFVFLLKSAFTKNGSQDTIGGVWIQEGAIGNVRNVAEHPAWTENFLTVNEYSRPGTPLTEVKDIFVHYTANPNTNAVQNRSYFEQLKDTHERGASAHFIIGYEGDILQCIPLNEVAYAVKTRNEDSISIECCYQNEDGSFTQETYDSLVELLAWLVHEYGLSTDHILRHYDCGGKKCPLYYTEHEDAWEQLKSDVDKALMDL